MLYKKRRSQIRSWSLKSYFLTFNPIELSEINLFWYIYLLITKINIRKLLIELMRFFLSWMKKDFDLSVSETERFFILFINNAFPVVERPLPPY